MISLQGPIDLQNLLFQAKGNFCYIVEEHDFNFTTLYWVEIRNPNGRGTRVDEIKRCKIDNQMRKAFNLPELEVRLFMK